MKSIIRGIIVLLAMAASASAGSLNIQLTGMDLTYDGTTLLTQGGADALTSVVITDAVGSPPIVYTTGIDIDLHVPDLTLPLGFPVSAAASAPGGSLTLNVPGGSLLLDLDPVLATYADLGVMEFTFGAASTTVIGQSIPAGSLCDPVTLSFSQTINPGSQTNDGSNLTGFNSFGTGEITAKPVPEPASAGLLGVAAMTIICLDRRRTA